MVGWCCVLLLSAYGKPMVNLWLTAYRPGTNILTHAGCETIGTCGVG